MVARKTYFLSTKLITKPLDIEKLTYKKLILIINLQIKDNFKFIPKKRP